MPRYAYETMLEAAVSVVTRQRTVTEEAAFRGVARTTIYAWMRAVESSEGSLEAARVLAALQLQRLHETAADDEEDRANIRLTAQVREKLQPGGGDGERISAADKELAAVLKEAINRVPIN